MARVELRDIVTEDDDEAVMGLRRGPGQDRYLGRMISHFEDAAVDAKACPGCGPSTTRTPASSSGS